MMFTGALIGAVAITAGTLSMASAEEEPAPVQRVENPYEGADVYVNPDWSANAEASGGSAVAD
ncbi:glycoside hydrolase family 6 protein, partial [Streptomyces sp. 6N223]